MTNNKEVILTILFNNPNMNIPEGLSELDAFILRTYQSEIKNLNQYTFNAGRSYRNLLLSGIIQEACEKKLALLSRNPEISEKVEALNPECPILSPMLEKQLKKGKRRIEALDSLSETFIPKKLPTEMWEQILDYLSRDDLRKYKKT